MTVLVTVETILLVLLALLVAGLLRSHAEILRRLEAGEAAAERREPDRDRSLPAFRPESPEVFDVVGTNLAGDAVAVAVRGVRNDTLLAFLSSGCSTCGPFWSGLAGGNRPRLPGDPRIVVVTRDSSHERPSHLLELAPDDVPLVMSSAAWDDYGVQGSPYFILVDGPGERTRGEGTAGNWAQVASLLADATADAALGSARSLVPDRSQADSTVDRLLRADRELRRAGIRPGHPSLYGLEVDRSGEHPA